MATPRLHWINDEGEEHAVLLTANETLLGRKNDANLQLMHGHVSRHHATIKKTDQGYLLLDLASVFGTFVNSRRVEHHILRDGDRIRLGDYEVDLCFFEGGNNQKMEPTDPAANSVSWLPGVSAVPAAEATPEKISQILSFEYRAEMVKNIKARKEFEGELDLAHETQNSLLPQALPGLDYLRIRAFSKPTRHVGGDFYDFLYAASGEFVGVLVDVSGKGVAASLLSSMLLGGIHTLFRTGSTLPQTVDQLNQFMCERCERSSGRFATMFVCTLNKNGQGEFISAGHNPAYLFRATSGGIEELTSNNTIVGAFDTARFKASPLHLYKGDLLVVYSDGLTDAENASGEMLGEEAVKEVIEVEAPAGAAHLEEKLKEAIHRFTQGHSQSDDITIMLIERT